MFIALERAKTAREAIQVMVDLANTYGYASHGESFTISDPDEVWIMEFVGKGKYVEFGKDRVVWVAVLIPDGCIAGHANQAVIHKYKVDYPETKVLHSTDVFTFAKERGFTNATTEDDFDFAAAYHPINFGGARFCDARVLTYFNHSGAISPTDFSDYMLGKDVSVRPKTYYKLPQDRKHSVADMMEFMRSHYEDTVLEQRYDVGAGPFNLPYRFRPRRYSAVSKDGKLLNYTHERGVGQVQTAWAHVAQCRSVTPEHPLGGIYWWGTDDSTTTQYIPWYTSLTSIPACVARVTPHEVQDRKSVV
jgi:dipeptidase